MKKYNYFQTKNPNKRNNIIGLAIPNMGIEFVGKLIISLEKELINTDYDLLLINLKGQRNLNGKFIEISFINKKIDALIFFSTTIDKEGIEFFRNFNIPIVFIQAICNKEKSIVTNNYTGVFTATTFLINQGYKNIAFIGWQPEDKHLEDRFNGYKNALDKFNIKFYPEMVSYNSLSIDGGYNATKDLLKKYSPDAIFYACDTMAYGGYKYFNENNIKIPGDIGIIGFDDLEISSVLGLTTMRQFYESKARLAIDYLLNNNRSTHRQGLCRLFLNLPYTQLSKS
jgi:LacI family transcriptional regulator